MKLLFTDPKLMFRYTVPLAESLHWLPTRWIFHKEEVLNWNIQIRQTRPETPLIIHRAPLGTHERFIGFLLEQYAGKLPLWLSPVQVKILPISDKFMDYAKTVLQQLKKADIRAEVDDRHEKIGKKIRDAELMKVPYMLVVGEKEMNENKVAIRRHGKGDTGIKSVDEFVNEAIVEIKERRSE
jgi:threonyl-tRNA synthetase